MDEKQYTWGVFQDKPDTECTTLDTATSPMVSLPPAGFPCGYLACQARSTPATSTGSTADCHTRRTSTKNTEQRTMRKAEMVQRIAQELGSTTAKAAAAVEAILTTIEASLQQGEPVILRRFGT